MKIRTAVSVAAIASVLAWAACGDGEPASGGGASARATEAGGGTQEAPAGWTVRTDRGDTVATPGRLTAADGGFRVRSGPRAIFFHPDSTATGRFRLSATFERLEEPPAPEAYGLFLGGRDLEGPNQDYLYFLIRKDGSYLVKHRAGEETHTVVEWTSSPAVRTAEGDTVRNELAVESDSAEVRFVVNGQTVRTLPRSEKLRTDGIVGVRINHRLDVRIRDFGTEALGAGS